MSKGYRAPIVTKAFAALDLLAAAQGSLSLSDLSRRLGIGKSTLHGILAALEDAGAVVRDRRTRRYSLGPTLHELGRAAGPRPELEEISRPFMVELMAATRESVFLGVRTGREVRIVEVVESTRDLKISAPVGTRLPLLAGAIGKVFLAGVPAEEAEGALRRLGLRRFTDKTITEVGLYLRELERVRESGYAVDDEEYISGVRAIAAAIPGPGLPLAAIWVVGFTPGLTESKMRAVGEKTCAAAESIGARLAPVGSG